MSMPIWLVAILVAAAAPQLVGFFVQRQVSRRRARTEEALQKCEARMASSLSREDVPSRDQEASAASVLAAAGDAKGTSTIEESVPTASALAPERRSAHQ
jgi:hypothetical protein